MPELRIDAGANHIFPADQLENQLELDNRHNVAGNVVYQIGARPAVTMPIKVGDERYYIRNINGLQLSVTNQLPNSLYAIW